MNNNSIGKIYGYARVSTATQSLDRQITALQDYGCEFIYQEKISGTKGKYERPELKKLLDSLQEGDTVIIAELTRVSRSLTDMLQIINEITAKGCTIRSLSESWIDTGSAHGTLLLQIFGALAEFERKLLLERCNSGRETAKTKGVRFGRPKRKDLKVDYAIELYNNKDYSVSKIEELTGVSRSTLYRRLREKQTA